MEPSYGRGVMNGSYTLKNKGAKKGSSHDAFRSGLLSPSPGDLPLSFNLYLTCDPGDEGLVYYP